MDKMMIGTGVASLWIRHARSLKDKRQITQSLMQKLKNEGFSTAELDLGENHKRAMIGFCLCSGSAAVVAQQLDKAKRIFIGDFEVVDAKTEVIEVETGFQIPWIEPED